MTVCCACKPIENFNLKLSLTIVIWLDLFNNSSRQHLQQAKFESYNLTFFLFQTRKYVVVQAD